MGVVLLVGGGSAPQAPPSPIPVPDLRYGAVDPPVIAQRDVTIRHPTSIHPVDPTPQPLECSGLAWLVDRLVLPSDRHSHTLFSLAVELGEGTVALGLPVPHPIVDAERELLMDAEAISVKEARTGARPSWGVYVFTSMSNDPTGSRRPLREHAARITVPDGGAIEASAVAVVSLSSLRDALDAHLSELGVELYWAFNSDQGENTPRWGSIEGIAWTPDGARLLCGMRTPRAGEDAMVAVVEGVDAAFDAGDGGLLRLVDLFRLDLGGRGISDMEWDPVTGGYLVTAARSNGRRTDPDQPYPLLQVDSALFWWSGDKSDPPRLVARMPDMNIDAVCRVGATTLIALGSDEGDVSEERRGHQSAVTLMHFPAPPARTGSAGHE